jgi:hypothetical protein
MLSCSRIRLEFWQVDALFTQSAVPIEAVSASASSEAMPKSTAVVADFKMCLPACRSRSQACVGTDTA